MLTKVLKMFSRNIAYGRAINNLSDSIVLIMDGDVKSKCSDIELCRVQIH